MSTFVTRLKKELQDSDNQRGMKDCIVVNRRDLKELLHHFERIDKEFRELHRKLKPEEYL